jgi:hypothetical protein
VLSGAYALGPNPRTILGVSSNCAMERRESFHVELE